MKTHTTKPSEITRDWWLVDADGAVLGRLASEVAQRLRGKHKPTFSPHLDTGDHVIVVNAAKIVMTGNKLNDKQMYRHSGYPGGLRSMPYSRLMVERPELVVEKAVKGMLPSNKLGRAMLKKLRVYAGPEHSHHAQNPQPLDLKEVAAPHNPEQAHTIEEVTGG
ncbi:MAG TPA: 50S ribosomal protein L13 [Actinomycetota bacterium]|nr:50S ribosomal protein L13 [Actinomycetota bacterium]